MTVQDREDVPRDCSKCGAEATSTVAIAAIHDGDAMESKHGICNDCLSDLGEWFRNE